MTWFQPKSKGLRSRGADGGFLSEHWQPQDQEERTFQFEDKGREKANILVGKAVRQAAPCYSVNFFFF